MQKSCFHIFSAFIIHNVKWVIIMTHHDFSSWFLASDFLEISLFMINHDLNHLKTQELLDLFLLFWISFQNRLRRNSPLIHILCDVVDAPNFHFSSKTILSHKFQSNSMLWQFVAILRFFIFWKIFEWKISTEVCRILKSEKWEVADFIPKNRKFLKFEKKYLEIVIELQKSAVGWNFGPSTRWDEETG